MPDLFTFFYGASLLLQILAAVVALDLYVHSSQYRWGWLLLALGLVALTFRRALMLQSCRDIQPCAAGDFTQPTPSFPVELCHCGH